uniref:Uncharacterized protein n=1 Tax=Fagus sylvatica TaxID=28930 RepID=A0A2N9IRT3_FAGSY
MWTWPQERLKSREGAREEEGQKPDLRFAVLRREGETETDESLNQRQRRCTHNTMNLPFDRSGDWRIPF